MLLLTTAHAQAPQGIPYQAAARNSSGAVIASTAISIRFTIRDSVTTGVIKYRETHSATTDANGMFSVNVGQGTPTSGTFAGINWAKNAKFMQVELDPAGGSSYIDMGTQQMMSVPYSLNGLPSGIGGDIMYHNGTNWVKLPAGTDGQVLVMSGGLPSWTGCLPPGVQLITSCTSTTSVGSSITFSNATTGGTWSSTNTAIATVGTSGVVSGIAEGTATISYTVTNSCGSAVAIRVVTVTPPLTLGASYGGGIIAYILVSGDPGYSACETHGIIAAPSDQSTGINWGCNTTSVGSTTSSAIGAGAINTELISAACGTGSAARLCADLVLGGYSDWYLPSYLELLKLYQNNVAIGGFNTSGSFYWSSTQPSATSATLAIAIRFSDGALYSSASKSFLYRVRAVRYF